MDQTDTPRPIGDRIETIDPIEFLSRFGSAEIPLAVFPKAPCEAWA
jgi:hypothetical protein